MISIRPELKQTDRTPILELLKASNFFNSEELAVALELIDDRLHNLESSHYRFLVAEHEHKYEHKTVGYACWGAIPGTAVSADLYWIAVHPAWQHNGIGKALLAGAEEWMQREKRSRSYIETSMRVDYASTRKFYQQCGYTLVAELPDYYAPNDGKGIYLKILNVDSRIK